MRRRARRAPLHMRSRRAATGAVPVGASGAAPAFREIHREYVERLPGFPDSIPSSVPPVGRREALSIHSHCQPGSGWKPRELCGFHPVMPYDRVRSLAAGAAIYFALALRRAAQYFFIRSDTAFRSAADIGLRRERRRPPPPADPVSASLDAARPADPRRPRNRSGNARRIAASSRLSSSRRDCAPSRANRCSSCRVKSATNPPWTMHWPRRPTR